jgi:probable F420-dependent oxidoreductase
VTERIELSTAVALPTEHDPITLAKTIASLDHISGGRVSLGAGFGWNTDELADHGIPGKRRRTALREYIEAMRALWNQEEASYDGEFVKFGPSWAWPKPAHAVPVLIGTAGTEQGFRWIAKSADGWITTPYETHTLLERLQLLRKVWQEEGREGAPRVVALAGKPDPRQLSDWDAAGVTDVLFGLPDKPEADVLVYLDRLAVKVGLRS